VVNKSHLSCEEKRVIESWKKLNPDYTYRLWDDADIRQFMLQVCPQANTAARTVQLVAWQHTTNSAPCVQQQQQQQSKVRCSQPARAGRSMQHGPS